MNFHEKREFVRIPIDIPILCELHFINDLSVAVILRDISQGGLQVDLSPGASLKNDFLGQAVTLKGLPKKIYHQDAGKTKVKVSWQSPERLGLRFTVPLKLSDEKINEIIANC